jgi:hypothetical protein
MDSTFLFASLIWGSIGFGYFIYGRRQQSVAPLIGGVLMIGASYLARSVLEMSLACLGLMTAVYLNSKRGW